MKVKALKSLHNIVEGNIYEADGVYKHIDGLEYYQIRFSKEKSVDKERVVLYPTSRFKVEEEEYEE